MLLRAYLEKKFKKVQDVADKMDYALIPTMLGLGDIYYVDATNGSDNYDGKSWIKAKATWDAAIGLCTADSGDRILMAPWHAESKTTTGNIALADIAGVTIIGLIQGNQRPTFTLGHAGTTISVTAANNRITGIKIISDVADCAAGLTVGAAADGLEVDHCIFTDGAAAKELVIGISLTAAASGCKIHDNEFYTVPAGGCATAITLVGESTRTVIENNIIQGDYSASAISGVTAAATLITIKNNIMVNIDTTAGSCVDLHNDSTAMVSGNRMMGGKSIADCIVGTGMATGDNYCTGAVNTSGILAEPAADADA